MEFVKQALGVYSDARASGTARPLRTISLEAFKNLTPAARGEAIKCPLLVVGAAASKSIPRCEEYEYVFILDPRMITLMDFIYGRALNVTIPTDNMYSAVTVSQHEVDEFIGLQCMLPDTLVDFGCV